MKSEKHRILLADDSKDIIQSLIKAYAAEHFQFEIANSGHEVFEKLDSFHPELIYLDLMLPEMHGIEILKKIRGNPQHKKVGIILASSNPMIQNYHAAVREGVNYFLKKPFEIDLLFSLFERFFSEGLSPDHFPGRRDEKWENVPIYSPQKRSSDAYLKFWGTRGSNPVSGTEYVRFGGNTSCLEVRYGNDLVIIDAGTGIRPLGHSLDLGGIKRVHLFFSHTHWDHITGFPFFQPIYQDCQVIIWSPVGFEKSTQELFTEMLAYAYFPVRLDDIQAKLIFKDLRDRHPVSIGDITIETHYAYHPGATLCFKIHVAGKTFGYATDNEMFLGYHGNPNAVGKDHPLIHSHESIINFFKNCHYLIHEAQYTSAEYQKRVGWGHSSISNATILVKYAQVPEWIVTHHDPKHTDDDLLKKQQLHKDILEDCHVHCHVHLAYDEMVIPI